MRLILETNELIEMCTYDNRRLSMKCTRHYDGVPSIDLLPRVRYCLRVCPTPRSNSLSSSLFFSHGLIVIPQESNDALAHKVIALNLSEKAMRVTAGKELSADGWSMSPSHSSLGTPPHGSEDSAPSDCPESGIHKCDSFYMDAVTPPVSLHTEMRCCLSEPHADRSAPAAPP